MDSNWYTYYNLTADRVPLSFPLPWNIGTYHSFFWICYITVLLLGVLINGATFMLMLYNKNIQKIASVPLVKYLVAEDFVFSLVCLTQCCLNFHHQRQYGDETGCVIEAWQHCFFISITGYTLCLIAYTMQSKVTAKSMTKRNPPIFKIHIGFWIFGVLFATGASVWPGTSRMTLSGTYCLPAFERPFSGLFFFGLAVFPTIAFLAVQYIWIFIYVSRSRRNLETLTEQRNTHKQLKLARQLSSLVLVYFIGYAPVLSSAIYEWSTHYFAVVMFDIAGVLAHCVSVANPVLYLWTTKQAKSEISKGMDFLQTVVKTNQRDDSVTEE